LDRVLDVKNLGTESEDDCPGELDMNSLRKKVERDSFAPEPQECEVNYSKEVTPEQIRKLDELVKSEFEHGNWVTVAGEA
jgi:hypothetical protein